ncbi:UdgX family uracil-DNA binding protein [Rhizobium sp. BK376]|jgi:DNA polymerase|uniref:UdgX family uracil-DNA binding protein n=1 Tax=Rhizobium sp. BK376 TaxID=2512149 RepID=UPI0010446F81|nr:UdgX family uracil-DNA binding protein [Rhizobium sp. BK376]TCR92224.1 DNA polymerase [Rhizobium sp. BK376]
MHRIMLEGRGDLAEWRDAARGLAMAGVPPEEVEWVEKGADKQLFWEHDAAPPLAGSRQMTVPPVFIELAESVICHSDPARFGLLYRLLWRLQVDRRLLDVASDEDVSLARLMAKSVSRDAHKMTAFVRFKEIKAEAENGRRGFAAWFEPDHHIVARKAPFFQRRFADMDWIIATPKGSAAWDGQKLTVSTEPCIKPDLADETDELWRTYYASIFNPARLKVKAMQAEMPKKYWKNLPEASLIPGLVADAEAKVLDMAKRQATEPLPFHQRLQEAAARVPAAPQPLSGTLEALREEARHCTRCELYCHATQTVFGEGPADAQVMFVGEQPGDQEDLAGRPFVGPAGKLFDQVLSETGIERQALYITGAVKHFKYEPRGKRRIHQRPNLGEVKRCRWWLNLEIELIKPKLVVAMGATALFALTDSKMRLSDIRGSTIPLAEDRMLFVTVHPSYLLRIPDEDRKAEELTRFHADMTAVRQLMQSFS